MPRLTRVRISALDDLLSQLRFAPGGVVRRHLANAEALARDLDPSRNYRVSELARRITGLRADPSEIEDATVVGRALAGEISAVVERLSHLAGLRFEELGGDALTLAQACERWGVDRRTIERWRREGLVGHRVILDGARAIAFRMDSVRAFERSRPAAGASRRGRTTERERLDIVRRALRAVESEGVSPNQAARLAAEQTGRAHETARRVVRNASSRHEEPLLRARRRVGARDRRVIARAMGRGVDVVVLSARFERSRASVHRLALEGRLDRLSGLDLRCPESETFRRADAGDVILAPPEARSNLAGRVSEPWDEWLESARALRVPSESTERAMGAALCYLRWRSARGLAAMRESRPSAASLDGVETDLRWAWWLASALARTQRGVGVRNLEERLGSRADALGADRARAVHEGLERALLRSALSFDPFRAGREFRLAGLSTIAVTRALASLSERGVLEAGRAGAARARGVGVEDVSWRSVGWHWLCLSPAARDAAAKLDGPLAEVVRLRWGLGGDGEGSEPPLTRAQTAARLNVGPTRVARLEQEWLRIRCGRA